MGYGQDHQYHFKDDFEPSRLLMFFHAKIDGEPVVDPGEADEWKWVTFSELKNHENKEKALEDFFTRNPDLKLGV